MWAKIILKWQENHIKTKDLLFKPIGTIWEEMRNCTDKKIFTFLI